MKTGVCSVTFRQHSPQQLIDLVVESGLSAIEWGGDVHVPPGNIRLARSVGQSTRDAGLSVSSYGSYYKVLDEAGRFQDFDPVLETTLALGTNTVRIWAGCSGSDATDEEYRKRLTEAAGRVARQAAAQNVNVALEFHRNTLTDTNESTAQLLQEINQPNLYTYWQPMYWGADLDDRLQGLELMKDKILNLHAFHWNYDESKPKPIDRRPLKEGAQDWAQYLSVSLPERTRYALIEFVRADDPRQFLEDANTLIKWLEEGPMMNS
jgi:3-dehydroshikimate dehydratase